MTRHDRRLSVLDGLRGIAALAVVIYHLTNYNAAAPFWFTPDGAVAVDFFFALSGFVLSRRHGDELRAGITSGAAFARLRIARMWPMLVLGTVIGAALIGVDAPLPTTPTAGELPATVFASLVGLPWYGRGVFLWVNGVFWSLTAELIVNFAYGAIGRHLSPARLAVLTIAAGAGFAIWSIAIADASLHFETPEAIVPSALRVIAMFFLGVFLERSGSVARVGAPPPLLVAAALVLTLWLGALVPVDSNYIYHLLASFVAIPLIIIAGAATTVRHERPWRWLGDASFPLYAIHLPVLLAVLPWIADAGRIERNLVRSGIVLTLFAAALLIERFLDKPARKWLRRKIV